MSDVGGVDLKIQQHRSCMSRSNKAGGLTGALEVIPAARGLLESV